MQTIYVSHSARRVDGSVEWFVVEPAIDFARWGLRDHPHCTREQAIQSLVDAGRTVYGIEAVAFNHERAGEHGENAPNTAPSERTS